MRKIIVVSTSQDDQTYNSLLVQNFTKGAKSAGLEVEIVSLHGKTLEVAYELGKRMVEPSATPGHAKSRPTIQLDVRIQKMVMTLGKQAMKRRLLIAELGLKQRSRPCFINNYLKPSLSQGLVEFAHPNSPTSPEQAYKLTAKGLELYNQLTK